MSYKKLMLVSLILAVVFLIILGVIWYLDCKDDSSQIIVKTVESDEITLSAVGEEKAAITIKDPNDCVYVVTVPTEWDEVTYTVPVGTYQKLQRIKSQGFTIHSLFWSAKELNLEIGPFVELSELFEEYNFSTRIYPVGDQMNYKVFFSAPIAQNMFELSLRVSKSDTLKVYYADLGPRNFYISEEHARSRKAKSDAKKVLVGTYLESILEMLIARIDVYDSVAQRPELASGRQISKIFKETNNLLEKCLGDAGLNSETVYNFSIDSKIGRVKCEFNNKCYLSSLFLDDSEDKVSLLSSVESGLAHIFYSRVPRRVKVSENNDPISIVVLDDVLKEINVHLNEVIAAKNRAEQERIQKRLHSVNIDEQGGGAEQTSEGEKYAALVQKHFAVASR